MVYMTYFNSIFGGFALPKNTAAISQPNKSRSKYPATQSLVTVLTSRDHPVNKKFELVDGAVRAIPYQNAYLFDAEVFPVNGIQGFASIIENISRGSQKILIRGIHPEQFAANVQRTKENFPEHEEGTPWVMLDFDDIQVPDGMNPLTTEAIEWLVQKLPAGFHGVTYFYQFSASAGILTADGLPRKKGINVHLFYWLNHRVPGDLLTAYLKKHCLDSGFYTIGKNRGGVPELRLGVDLAPIRTSNQPHFIAKPETGPGVNCVLSQEARHGFIAKQGNEVAIPALAEGLIANACNQGKIIRDEYCRANGYKQKTMQTRTGEGFSTHTYFVPEEAGTARGGREFKGCKLERDQYCILYFADENSPGSWYVTKKQPQIARRYGDGESLPLKELSEGAYVYVRDTLGWFTEIPVVNLSLTEEGYLPPFNDFATAKISLILAPTGSGKTKAAIDWIRSRQKELTIYAAPTIALVQQMFDDLETAGMEPYHYDWTKGFGSPFPNYGVVVTTIESLHKMLRITYDRCLTHNLILDEVHHGMETFMTSNHKNELLENTLVKSRQTLLLTGTCTPVQRTKLSQLASHALMQTGPAHYCTYEFAPVRQNPLHIRKLGLFDTDFITLLEEYRAKKQRGERLPRVAMLLSTSRMETYRILLGKYELLDQADIVSRPEYSAEDIEAARISDKPILISSPLFALGLNFSTAPEKFWCRFDYLDVDTSQVIQTVNRANRTAAPCEVRVYVGMTSDDPIYLMDDTKLAAKVRESFQMESSLEGFLEQHSQIDRNAYNLLRKAEKDTPKALGRLIANDGFQNYRIVQDLGETCVLDEKKAKICEDARKAARSNYDQAIVQHRDALSKGDVWVHFWRLDKLADERKNGWEYESPRTEREIESEELGVIMRLCNLSSPAQAKQVKVSKLRRLFGDGSPWISAQYDREKFTDWAKVEAEKTEHIRVVVQKLAELKTGKRNGFDLAGSLTRNRSLIDGLLALATGESEYLSLRTKLDTLEKRREGVRKSGSAQQRAKIAEAGLNLMEELLKPLGVFFDKTKGADGRRRVDFTKPIVPSTWNLDDMAMVLMKRATWLKSLPVEQKVPIVSDEYSVGDKQMSRDICEGCVFFFQNACVQGKQVDWQGGGWEGNLTRECGSFKRIPVRLAA